MKNHTGAAENAELYNHELSRKVIGCAIEVHRSLGPGLEFQSELAVPLCYKGVKLDCAYRLDFLVDYFLVIEVKALDALANIHQAQLLTYMRLTEAPLGLLLNFNVKLLKDGIKKCAITDFSALSAAPV